MAKGVMAFRGRAGASAYIDFRMSTGAVGAELRRMAMAMRQTAWCFLTLAPMSIAPNLQVDATGDRQSILSAQRSALSDQRSA
jgi:hypothetical protein